MTERSWTVVLSAVRRLGSLRPFIGAIFAVAIYFAFASKLIRLGTVPRTIYFYAFVSFLALPLPYARSAGHAGHVIGVDPRRAAAWPGLYSSRFAARRQPNSGGLQGRSLVAVGRERRKGF